jgi:Predicted membrane protein (DUF2232)
MTPIILIGLASGTAAALLFAAMTSGSMAAILLFYLAPLPILIAALGWSHWAALIGVAVAAGELAVLGLVFPLIFLLGIGLPAWWLGYLVLLARPVPTPDGREWYPIGRLVLWTAVIGALLISATMLDLGTDAATLENALRDALKTALDVGSNPDQADDMARLIDTLVLIVPAAAAASAMLVSVFNLWLAGRVVKLSGRLRRPWPSISAMRFPAYAPAALGLAVVCSFLPEMIGISSRTLAASLMMAHVLLGLAVIHAVTIGIARRGFILGSIYAAIVLSSWLVGWLLLFIGLIGVTDALFDLRGLIARTRGPPAAHP